MGTTPLHALPYPELADPADAHKGYQDLANAVDPLLLPTTSVVAAATRIVANLLAASDPQPAFRIMGDGRQEWGAGGAAALDTNLYRSAAGTLKTDGALVAGAGTLLLNTNSAIYFGASWDTSLSRPSAGVLQSDGSLVAGGNTSKRVELAVDRLGGGQAAINFGSAGDATLYRSAAGQLATSGSLVAYNGFFFTPTTAAGNVLVNYAPGEAQPRFYIDIAGTMRWGPGGSTNTDTTLYRSAANTLRTDGSLYVGTGAIVRPGDAAQVAIGSLNTLVGGGPAAAGIALGNAGDTTLYRSAANALKTDGLLAAQYVSTDNMAVGWYNNNPGPGFALRGGTGGAYDTFLYRNGANVLALYNTFGLGWGTMMAAAFAVQSDRKTKSEIERAAPLHERLLSATVYRYRRDDSETKHLGLIADELPDDVLTTGASGDGDAMQFVDVYKLCALLVQTVQHLNGRLSTLEAQSAPA